MTEISNPFTILTILRWRSTSGSIQTITYSASVPGSIEQFKMFVSAARCRLSVQSGEKSEHLVLNPIGGFSDAV